MRERTAQPLYSTAFHTGLPARLVLPQLPAEILDNSFLFPAEIFFQPPQRHSDYITVM
jgi:hypothetical protein